MLIQTATHITLNVTGAESVFATTFYPLTEAFALHFRTVRFQRLLKHVVHASIRTLFHLFYVADTRYAAQQVDDQIVFAFVFAANFDMIPVANYREGLIMRLYDVTDAACEDLNEAQTHRLTLDGDFWEQFNDKLHGSLLLAVRIRGSESLNRAQRAYYC